jgi:hypothetical protein
MTCEIITHPEPNVTGVSGRTEFEVHGKRLEIFLGNKKEDNPITVTEIQFNPIDQSSCYFAKG